MLKKTKEIVLSFEDRNKFASFILILMQIDKRVNKKRAKSKKDSKAKLDKIIDPPISGPFLFKTLVFIYN